MDHDHSSMPDHSGHSMPSTDIPRCSMNMLWNSQVQDVCVVFERWHITGWVTMGLSCLVVTLISLLYASLLHQIQTYDRRLAYSLHSSHSSATSRRESMMPTSEASRRVSLIPPNPTGYSVETGGTKVGAGVVKLGLGRRWERAGMYALSVAISFWLMLVAMTYNTYLFASIILGAFLGHLLYEGEMDVGTAMGQGSGKGLACH